MVGHTAQRDWLVTLAINAAEPASLAVPRHPCQGAGPASPLACRPGPAMLTSPRPHHSGHACLPVRVRPSPRARATSIPFAPHAPPIIYAIFSSSSSSYRVASRCSKNADNDRVRVQSAGGRRSRRTCPSARTTRSRTTGTRTSRSASPRWASTPSRTSPAPTRAAAPARPPAR